MSSHAWTGPQDEIGEQPATPRQHTNDDRALPVLQEVDIVYETHPTLDLRGRKHLDRRADGQLYHFREPDGAPPSYLALPMAGGAGADALRGFLRAHLRPKQVVDEYGDVCGMSGIANDQLPVLQARLWGGLSGPLPEQMQGLDSGHVSRITQLLEGMLRCSPFDVC